MERRAASHTEEEEMNQRRKLLNAARRGDTKAISKLFELYQVRVLSGEQLVKVNRTSAYMTPVKHSHSSKSKAAEKKDKSNASKTVKKSGEVSKPVATKAPTSPSKKSAKSTPKRK
ncbi:MAG: hypothetical protein E8D48_00250 [Nitrospira sp.]|nr:MAG: hypothetical protein E8D48_00250 [Nitrospira sp.]